MDEGSNKNYKALISMSMLTFLGLYVGCGIIFTIMGTKNPFGKVPRYVAVMATIVTAMISHDRDTPISKKIDIYCKGAGDSRVMLLGITVLMTGGFSFTAATIDGKESTVNTDLILISSHFLISDIFIVTCFISTCIGTSMGTQATMIPVAAAVAQDAGPNVVMAGVTVIAGAYLGDNLFMISNTTTRATKGVGAEMRDKFRINFLITSSATTIAIVLYLVLEANGSGPVDIKELYYNVLGVLPYLIVLVAAIAGLDALLALLIGILMPGVIGMVMSTVTSFEWTMATGTGIEKTFFPAAFSMLVSDLAELIKYYGGTA